MAGENYTVNYDINVLSQDAVNSIRSFTNAIQSLDKAQKNFVKINNQLNQLQQKLSSFNTAKVPQVRINTKPAIDSVNKLIGKLNQLQQKAGSMNLNINAITTGGGGSGTAVVGGGGGKKSPAKPKTRTYAGPRKKSLSQVRYGALGQTLIDTGGVGVLDFAKGMGIAYGIAGLGNLVGSTVKEAVDYNNIIKTTENILKTHDMAPNFSGRFSQMERVARNVGVETKFTAAQVADATKFLAMAGFDVDAINKSIRPIADIALAGDTDLGETADVVTNIMTGYGISPDRVRQAADVMTMTFTKSNTTLMEIAESYKYAASLLALNGTSFEEATAAIGILGDAGIKGSQAGTTMRTLALNIAKPTKGQAAMWEQLGISRTDSSGKIRPLVDVFQDLHDKNLTLSQFGALFHKTAAQGAASLAENVDKWNEIIRLNFLSEGTVGRLADEKKNTIEGLWYQLTSSFTEAGMKAFSEQEGEIRRILTQGINWLQSPQAVEMIKRLGQAVMDIGKTLLDFTKIVVKLWEQFDGLILTWLKAQLYFKGVLIPLRIFNSVINFGKYIGGVAVAVSNLTRALGALSGLNWSQILVYLRNVTFGKSLGHDPMAYYRWPNQRKNAEYRQLEELRRNPPIMPIQPRGTTAVNAIGTTLFGAGGAYLGSMIGERGSGWNAFSTIAGGVAGTAIGSNIFTKFAPAIAKWLSGLTAGVIGVTAAVGYGVYKIVDYYVAVEKAGDAMREFYDSTVMVNGINMSEHASLTDKSLSIVYNKQIDANTALGEYINLRKEELGLLQDLNNASSDPGMAMKDIAKYSGALGDIDKKFGFATAYRHWKQAIDWDRNDIQNLSEDRMEHYRFNGIDFKTVFGSSKSVESVLNELAAAQFLYNAGYDTSEGSAAKRIIDHYQTQYLQAQSVSDFNAVQSNLETDLGKLRSEITPGSEYWGYDTVAKNSLAANEKGYHFVMGQIDAIRNSFQPDDKVSIWKEILGLHDAGEEIPTELLNKFLVKSGVDIFNTERYGAFGSDEFLANMGFKNGIWNPTAFTDASGTTYQLTAEKAREHYLMFHQQVVDIVRRLSPKLQGYFDSFINSNMWHPEEIVGLANGATKVLDGVSYTWDGNHWVPPTPTGLPALTNSEMNQKTALTKATSGAGGDTGGSSSDGQGYTNNYKSTSAVPKQIIVKIENLMNVENVDMNDPNVAATIGNLKEHMAQALIDVVADFDANAGNLA